MKKEQLDHILRSAGTITGEKQFVIIGSQALHAQYPDLPDLICASSEVDLFATANADRTEWLNVIGVDSPFHEEFGYYADPVDERTAVLPKDWKDRLIQLPPGDTGGVRGLCLDPHDLAISKYVARREKDILFNRALVRRGIVKRKTLLALLARMSIEESVRQRIHADIERDFK
jgi:hypothetical protein